MATFQSYNKFKDKQTSFSATTPQNGRNTSNPAAAPQDEASLPLGKCNFYAMLCATVLIIVGFILMAGSPSSTEAFNEDIFSARRIIIGPALSFIGFVAMALAIIIKPKSEN